MTKEQIEEILRTAYPNFGEPILEREEANRRAGLIHKDMKSIGLDLTLKWWKWWFPNREDPVGIPSYLLLDSDFCIDGKEGEDVEDAEDAEVYLAEGPGLNCGDYVRLSRACKVGHEITSQHWPQKFTKRLRDPNAHLAAVEEVLWLGYWNNPRYVKQSYKQNPKNNKDIDWRFKCGNRIVNLEVKYRRRDWVGAVDGEYFSRDFDSYFDDVEGKFVIPPVDELNVIGISTLSAPDPGLQRCIARYFENHPEVDAIIVWSYNDPEAITPTIFSRVEGVLDGLFVGETEESLFRISPIEHVLRKSEERRALRPGEFPKELLDGE